MLSASPSQLASCSRLCMLECPGGQPQALFESLHQLSDHIPMLLCTRQEGIIETLNRSTNATI
jgi:hypothetical protein